MSLHLDITNPKTEAKLTAAAHLRGIDFETLIDLAIDGLPPVEETKPQELGAFGGRTLADIVLEIGGVEGLPSDLSENAKTYLVQTGFGEKKSRTI